MPFMNISCPRCAEVSDLDAMTHRPVSGWLPPGQFQCPKCNHAFQRREIEPGHTFEWNGQREYIQGKVGLVPCNAVL